MRNRLRKYLLFALLGLSAWFLFFAVTGSRVLTVYFLDVGQGDAALIRFPCGKNMLIDAGEARQSNTDLVNFLRGAGVRRIDAVVLTHAHSDHAGGLPKILERFPVGVFIEPGHPHTTDLYINLLELVTEKGIPYKNVSRGDALGGFGEVEISFLNPPGVFYSGESALNNNSIVMLLRYKEVTFLFTGDIERQAESELVRIYEGYMSARVLKVPHHGSGTSSSPGFVEAVSPAAAVISAGRDNMFGHPHSSVVERYKAAGTDVLRTDVDGTVEISTDGSRLRVRTGR